MLKRELPYAAAAGGHRLYDVTAVARTFPDPSCRVIFHMATAWNPAFSLGTYSCTFASAQLAAGGKMSAPPLQGAWRLG
jgi:hypothetical protein